MIVLRQLCEKDAEYMLEWMHDPETQKCFQKDMMGVMLEDARCFCKEAGMNTELHQGQSLHLAIADEKDEYLGTISLKNLNLEYRSAEFAISLRKMARGQGVAVEAVQILLKKGFEELGLHRIY